MDQNTEQTKKITAIHAEICCDYCNDVIHNHIDCISCGKKYSETDAYHELETGEEFICDRCNAKYKCLDGSIAELLERGDKE